MSKDNKFSWDSLENPKLKTYINECIKTCKNNEFEKKSYEEISNIVDPYIFEEGTSDEEQRCRMTNVINTARIGVKNIDMWKDGLSKYDEGTTNNGTTPVPNNITPAVARTYLFRNSACLVNILMYNASKNEAAVWTNYVKGANVPNVVVGDTPYPSADDPKYKGKAHLFSGKCNTVGKYFKEYFDEEGDSAYVEFARCVFAILIRTRTPCVVMGKGNGNNQLSAFISKIFPSGQIRSLLPIISHKMRQTNTSKSNPSLYFIYKNNNWEVVPINNYIRYQVTNESFEDISHNDEGENNDSLLYKTNNYTMSAEDEMFKNIESEEIQEPTKSSHSSVEVPKSIIDIQSLKFIQNISTLINLLSNDTIRAKTDKGIDFRYLRLLAGYVLFHNKNEPSSFIKSITKAGAVKWDDDCFHSVTLDADNPNQGVDYHYNKPFYSGIAKSINSLGNDGFVKLMDAFIQNLEITENDPSLENDPELKQELVEFKQKNPDYIVSGARPLINLICQPTSVPTYSLVRSRLINKINSILSEDPITESSDYTTKYFTDENGVFHRPCLTNQTKRSLFGGNTPKDGKTFNPKYGYTEYNLKEAIRSLNILRAKLFESKDASIKIKIKESINTIKKIIEANNNSFLTETMDEDKYFDEFIDSLHTEKEIEDANAVIGVLRHTR